MTGETVILIGTAVIFLAVIGLIIASDLVYPRGDFPITERTTPTDPTMPTERPRPAWSSAPWPPLCNHAAPSRPPTVDQAHEIMRQHRDCLVDECARKRAAHRTLVQAGRLVPRKRR